MTLKVYLLGILPLAASQSVYTITLHTLLKVNLSLKVHSPEWATAYAKVRHYLPQY